MTGKGMIEAFRGGEKAKIPSSSPPERERIKKSPIEDFLLCHSRNLLSGIHVFAFLFETIGALPPIIWIPDRTIQE